MNRFARKLSLSLAIGFIAFGLGACNTMRGVGEDTQKVGEKIQKEADEHDDNDDVPATPAGAVEQSGASVR